MVKVPIQVPILFEVSGMVISKTMYQVKSQATLRLRELGGVHGMRRLDRLGFGKMALREGRATV